MQCSLHLPSEQQILDETSESICTSVETPVDVGLEYEAHCSLKMSMESKSVCGRWALLHNESGRVIQFRCGSRKCSSSECKRLFWWRRVRLLTDACHEHKLVVFFTLTLDPKTIPCGTDPWKYLPKCWGNFTRVFRRKFIDWKYIAILEKHKTNDRPHIHGFTNLYIDWVVWRKHWRNCNGGDGVWLETVRDAKEVGTYLSKGIDVYRYVGKDQVCGIPENVRRALWRSNGIKTKRELTSTGEWCIVKEDVFVNNVQVKEIVNGEVMARALETTP